MNASKILFVSLFFLVTIGLCEAVETNATDTSSIIEESDTYLADNYGIDEILEKLEEELAHFVIFAFCDITGNIKEIVMPIDQTKDVLQFGLSLSENKLLIKPDVSTLRFLPWTTDIHRTAWFMCAVHKNQTESYEADPRAILAALNNEVTSLGYAFDVGIELDFFLLEKNDHGSLVPADQANYLESEYNLTKQQEMNLIIHALRDFNIGIEKIDHGIANGQWRITLKNADVLQIADNTIACKYALKFLTNQLRQHITFMPKPFHDKNGNKMLIKYTLFNKTKSNNAFYDKADPFKLSAIGRHFLAGNLEKILETTALFAPTVNSYKNDIHALQKYNCWSPISHTTMFNAIITEKDEREEKLWLKCKMADCTSNIYLTLAALLKSGIQGIKKSKSLMSPLDESQITNNTPTNEQVNSGNFSVQPADFGSALTIFEKSDFAKKLLSDVGHTKFIELKRAEWHEYSSFITDWEFKKYL